MCLHALSLLLHAQSKVRDAEYIYMRYLYEKHKNQLHEEVPQADVSSEEHSVQSDNPERVVEFI